MKSILVRTLISLLAVTFAVSCSRTSDSQAFTRGANTDAARILVATTSFLASLTDAQRAKATFAFDDEERFNWHESPRPRQGISLGELNEAQRALGMELVKASLGQSGYQKVEMIRAREPLMDAMHGGNRFSSDRYYFSVFGTPSLEGRWGWRFEGHHVSLNYAMADGEVISVSPLFLGARPANVQEAGAPGRADAGVWTDAARKVAEQIPSQLAVRALSGEEDKGRELVRSLDEQQRDIAMLNRTEPRDSDLVSGMNNRSTVPLARPGLYARQMNERQKALLMSLIEEYLSNMPADFAARHARELRAGGLEEVAFSWSGETGPGRWHYYTVQSPRFLIDYAQGRGNLSNHTHTVWREFENDFGIQSIARSGETR